MDCQASKKLSCGVSYSVIKITINCSLIAKYLNVKTLSKCEKFAGVSFPNTLVGQYSNKTCSFYISHQGKEHNCQKSIKFSLSSFPFLSS